MPLFGPPDIAKLELDRDVNGLVKALHKKYPEYIQEAALKAISHIYQGYSIPKEKLASLGKDQLTTLYEMLSHKDEGARRTAAWILGEHGDPDSFEKIVPLLGDEKGIVRVRVIKSLGRLGDKRATKLLLDLLPGDYVDMTSSILIALGEIGDVSFVEPLLLEHSDIGDRIVDPIVAVGEDALPVLNNLQKHEDLHISLYAEMALNMIKKKLADT